MQPTTIDRDPRVRFKHPVRVVPIGGPPRAYRVLASNLSKDGMFLRMPTPFDTGTKVALSLEAGGRVLPFAQGEVVWRDLEEAKAPGRGAGFGVRFTGFLHPRAHELVDYLVQNLETGKPLSAPEPASPWRKRMVWIAAGLAAVILGAGITTALLKMYRAPPVEVAKAAPIEEVKALPVVEVAPLPAPIAAVAATTVDAPANVEAAKVEAPKVEAPKVEAPAPVKLAAPAAEAQSFAIPSGAVKSITTTVEGSQLLVTLTLATGAGITKAFTLARPDRLAIDVHGAAPKKSHTVSGSGVVQKVRIGKLPKGTRIVLDLSRAPGKPVVVSGSSVSVPLR